MLGWIQFSRHCRGVFMASNAVDRFDMKEKQSTLNTDRVVLFEQAKNGFDKLVNAGSHKISENH